MKKQFESLSNRERQVLSLAAIGLSDKKIGVELGVTINTMRTYWERVRKKVGPLTRAAIVAAFVAQQIGDDELALFHVMQINGWVMDAETYLVRASKGHNERHGLRHGVAHHKKEYAKLVHSADRAAYIAQVERVRTGDPVTLHIVYRTRIEGAVQTEHLTLVGVLNGNGKTSKVYGLLTTHFDCRPKKN